MSILFLLVIFLTICLPVDLCKSVYSTSLPIRAFITILFYWYCISMFIVSVVYVCVYCCASLSLCVCVLLFVCMSVCVCIVVLLSLSVCVCCVSFFVCVMSLSLCVCPSLCMSVRVCYCVCVRVLSGLARVERLSIIN